MRSGMNVGWTDVAFLILALLEAGLSMTDHAYVSLGPSGSELFFPSSCTVLPKLRVRSGPALAVGAAGGTDLEDVAAFSVWITAIEIVANPANNATRRINPKESAVILRAFFLNINFPEIMRPDGGLIAF